MTPMPTRFTLYLPESSHSAQQRRPGRIPRRAIEVAKRHRRGAARPHLVAPLMDHDFGDMGEARRNQRRSGLAQRLQQERPSLDRGAAENDFGRREQRDQIGDREAERVARRRENADEALVAFLSELDDLVELLADFGEAVAFPVDGVKRLPDDRGFGGDRGEAVAAVAGVGTDEKVAEIGRKPTRAAKQLAIMHDAEAEIVLDADDEEIAQTFDLAEPMLGQRDEVDVRIDR